MNNNGGKVERFIGQKRYSDFRVLVDDLRADYPNVSKGIIVLFDDNHDMAIFQVCNKSQLAFAGADLLFRSTQDGDEA